MGTLYGILFHSAPREVLNPPHTIWNPRVGYPFLPFGVKTSTPLFFLLPHSLPFFRKNKNPFPFGSPRGFEPSPHYLESSCRLSISSIRLENKCPPLLSFATLPSFFS